MNIKINEQEYTFEKKVTLTDVLKRYQMFQPYAILLNDEFIPKSEHAGTWLKENDKVDVVGAIQGG